MNLVFYAALPEKSRHLKEEKFNESKVVLMIVIVK